MKKSVYNKGEEIVISSSFKYKGEKEISFTVIPTISIVIRDDTNGKIYKEIDFKKVSQTMRKGDIFNQETTGLFLEKNKYSAFVQTSSFTVENTSPSQYNLTTTPINFEVK